MHASQQNIYVGFYLCYPPDDSYVDVFEKKPCPYGRGVGLNRSVGGLARSHRKRKCWRVRESKPNCMLVSDVAMDRESS